MWAILKTLYHNKLLSPKFIIILLFAIIRHGLNLFTLLVFTSKRFPNHVAVTMNQSEVTYKVLHHQVSCLMNVLNQQLSVNQKSKTAILANNSLDCIKHIIACSGLGTHLYMLNPNLTAPQIMTLIKQLHLENLIYDPQYTQLAILSQENINLIAMDNPLFHPKNQLLKKIKPSFSGKITLLTSGTTGMPKAVSRQPSLHQFMGIFHVLFSQLRLHAYGSVLIATPLYHGFGFATLCMSLALGKKMFVTEYFDAQKSIRIIQKNRIEVITLVPIMLQRIINHAPSQQLSSIKCIVCGGAVLPSTLVKHTQDTLGSVLFNLYGTSEAGVCTIATPKTLEQHPNSIGKAIRGTKLTLYDTHHQIITTDHTVGLLYASNPWSSEQIHKQINTKDLAYQNKEGYLFLAGRQDDMIISGGENVYPIELENILSQHAAIAEACVIGIKDDEFGQRLQAFVVLKTNVQLTKTQLFDWLSLHTARHQKPKYIVFMDALPYSSLGKIDKKQLVQRFNLSDA
ncbi:AMP-binding protein [Neisseria sp. Ec49-e6-T10]|uniref:AMP-binding protein n=1 Tax=Neisseria sp. Ec49-e6-T10 TaxID=3140744 RepID=UPI003EBB8D12